MSLGVPGLALKNTNGKTKFTEGKSQIRKSRLDTTVLAMSAAAAIDSCPLPIKSVNLLTVWDSARSSNLLRFLHCRSSKS